MPNLITLVTFGNCYDNLITLLLALLVKTYVLHENGVSSPLKLYPVISQRKVL